MRMSTATALPVCGAPPPEPARHLYRRRLGCHGRRPVNRADEYPYWRPKPPGGQLRIDRRQVIARRNPSTNTTAYGASLGRLTAPDCGVQIWAI